MTSCSVKKIEVELLPELDQEAGALTLLGMIKLEKVDDSGTLVTGNIDGMMPGTYNLHIFHFDDIRDECSLSSVEMAEESDGT